MITIYFDSLVIGLVVGLVVGIAISLFAIWKADNELYEKNGSNFSRGYDKGWIAGVNYQKVQEIMRK